MAIDKEAYLAGLSKGEQRSTTKNLEVLAVILVDVLDVLTDTLAKLEEVRAAIEAI